MKFKFCKHLIREEDGFMEKTTMSYNGEKWADICNTTLSNYVNIKKRLKKKEKTSNVILIYYSIFLIVSSLTTKFFSEIYSATLSEYFNIIISVILLTYSLVNNNARYVERIDNIEKSINALKSLKREIDDTNLGIIAEKYNAIVDKSEMREDVDFFITVKHLCKENDICWFQRIKKIDDDATVAQKKLKNYLSEINPLVEQTKIIIYNLWLCFLYLLPVLIFFVNFLLKR